MNCANHPETPVASYCQNCGKALCNECTRPVGGFIYCEQCLAARVGAPGAPPFAPGAPSTGPNPGLAALLGFIPGVGAMYNGQFVKAMIHVLVFVILIAITDQHGFFSLFLVSWVLYQVFDANQTARARRDGLPLPDPFGINELANRLGNQYPSTIPPVPNPPPPAGGVTGVPPAGYPPPPPGVTAAPFVEGAYPPPAAAYAPPQSAAYPPQPPAAYPPPGAAYPPSGIPPVPPPPFPVMPPFQEAARRSEPIGAIILIALGLLFLFGTLGIFNVNWIGRGWPLIIIVIGVWLFFKQARRTLPPPGGGQ
jgi:TM2 domain-containing membrane protein YozV